MKDNQEKAGMFLPFFIFYFLFFNFTFLDDSFSYFNFNSNDVFTIGLLDLWYILQAVARLGLCTRLFLSHSSISCTSSKCGSPFWPGEAVSKAAGSLMFGRFDNVSSQGTDLLSLLCFKDRNRHLQDLKSFSFSSETVVLPA